MTIGQDPCSKSVAFIAMMLVVGRRMLPWLLLADCPHRLA
jgi:predicted Kef-type K+ transport protein